MDIEIRRCSVDEVAVLASLEPPGRDFAANMFKLQLAGRCDFLVAWRGDEPVGSAELTKDEFPELKNLNVRAEHRGKGIGTMLVEAAERAIAATGLLSLGVATDNQRAASLYERLGYERTGVFSDSTYEYVDDEGMRRTATETDETLTKHW